MKKIKATNFNELVEELNHNFSVLLASPLFRGLAGAPGSLGNDGPQGSRGSLWSYIDLPTLNTEFSSTYVAEDLTETLITTLINSDITKFVASTSLTSFSLNDMLIAPDGKVYSWNGSTMSYTGVDLVTPDEAISYQDALTILQQNGLSASSAITTYETNHKRYKDTSSLSASNSSTVFADSVLDVLTNSAGPGFLNTDIQAVGLKNGIGVANSQRLQLMNISGHVEDLHDIIQSALAVINTDTVIDATQIKPGQVPAQVFLQNDRVTGLALGHRLDSSLAKFGQISMVAENVMMLSNEIALADHDNRMMIGESITGFSNKFTSMYGEGINIDATDGIRILSNYTNASQILELDANNILKSTYQILTGLVSGQMPGYTQNLTLTDTKTIKEYVDNHNWRMSDINHGPKWYAEVYYDWEDSTTNIDAVNNNGGSVVEGGYNRVLPGFNNRPDRTAASGYVYDQQDLVYVMTRVVAPSLGRLNRRIRQAEAFQFSFPPVASANFDNPNGVSQVNNEILNDFGGVSGVYLRSFVIDSLCTDNPFNTACLISTSTTGGGSGGGFGFI